MYSILGKYKEHYAVQNEETGEVEAISQKDILALLYFSLNIEGVSIDANGDLLETSEIQEFTDEDIRGAQEQEDLEELEDLELDFDDFDEDEDETEDSDGQFEGLDDDELLGALNESYAYRDSVLGNLGFKADETDDSEEQAEEDDYEEIEEEDLGIDADSFSEDDYDDYDYVDDEEDDITVGNTSTISKLYSLLTEEQVKLLKRYYLWYSQDLFITARKDPTLGYSDKNRLAIKKSQLNNLRNSGGQWYYAGFIDTGADGGGYCTLGHKLRYMHIAWDVTVSDIQTAFFGEFYDKDIEDLLDEDSCIIFGIKCISDFFEVDSDCTHALQRAQRDSLKDMEIIYDIYTNGEVEEVINSFTLMDEIVSRIDKRDKRGRIFGGTNFVPVFKKDGLTEFYKQFRKIGLPVPKSLVQELRDNLVGWLSHKFTGTLNRPVREKYNITLERVFGKDYEMLKEIYELKDSAYRTFNPVTTLLDIIFTYECCGYYKYNADTNKDEGGSSRRVRAGLLTKYSQSKVFKDDKVEYTLEFAVNYARTIYDLYNNLKATDIDLDYVGDMPEMRNEEYKNYSRALHWFTRTGDLFYTIPEGYRHFDKIGEYFDLAIRSLKELEVKKRKQEGEDEARRKEQEALEEEKNRPTPDSKVLDFFRTADVSKYAENPDFKLACDIVQTVIKRYGGNSASPKQLYHLRRLYTEMTGKTTLNDNKQVKEAFPLKDYPEYIQAIDYMLSQTADSSLKSICKSIKRQQAFTKKQEYYLKQAIDLYNAR